MCELCFICHSNISKEAHSKEKTGIFPYFVRYYMPHKLKEVKQKDEL